MNSEEILTLPEVATRLKTSTKTVRRRIASGALRAFKEGGRVCVLLSDLVDYLQQQINSTATK